MSPDRIRLAEALAVERIYGDAAPVHVAERIGALAIADDVEGIERWRAIARTLAALTAGYHRLGIDDRRVG
jgi:hypothetical protein